ATKQPEEFVIQKIGHDIGGLKDKLEAEIALLHEPESEKSFFVEVPAITILPRNVLEENNAALKLLEAANEEIKKQMVGLSPAALKKFDRALDPSYYVGHDRGELNEKERSKQFVKRNTYRSPVISRKIAEYINALVKPKQ
ncbi:MAG: hypothetical protein V1811_00525, partial [Candidatus Micrarchaeota archaeon]